MPGEYYHIYIRTVLSIPYFKEQKHAERLKLALLIANYTNSSEAFQFIRNNKKISIKKLVEILKKGEKLTDILSYSIMPNHYHLLVRERKKKGIINFISKCNVSIAKYINIKNDRKGPLFESRFQSKHIDSNEYLLHLSVYIHLNPLDFIVGKKWRKHELKNWKDTKNKLLAYPWSSLKSFLDKKHSDPLISGTEIIQEQFESGKDYERFLREWSEESFE